MFPERLLLVEAVHLVEIIPEEKTECIHDVAGFYGVEFRPDDRPCLLTCLLCIGCM